MAERFFAERRLGVQDYGVIGYQPAEGFSSERELREWLETMGLVRRQVVEGEVVLIGWGGERGIYARSVPAPARLLETPGEPITVASMAEFEREFGLPPSASYAVGAHGTMFAVTREPYAPLWRRAGRLLARLLRR